MGIGLLYRRDLRNLLIFEIAFFLAYKYGMNLSSAAGAPFWFPDSVLLCALLLSPPGIWWAYIVAPLPLRLLVAVTPGLRRMWFLLLAFANDSLKGLVAAYLTRRALHGRKIRFIVFHDLWSYLMAAVVLAPALSGFAGAAAWLALGHEFLATWRKWFLGDALANLVCTPLLLYLAQDWRKFASGDGRSLAGRTGPILSSSHSPPTSPTAGEWQRQVSLIPSDTYRCPSWCGRQSASDRRAHPAPCRS